MEHEDHQPLSITDALEALSEQFPNSPAKVSEMGPIERWLYPTRGGNTLGRNVTVNLPAHRGSQKLLEETVAHEASHVDDSERAGRGKVGSYLHNTWQALTNSYPNMNLAPLEMTGDSEEIRAEAAARGWEGRGVRRKDIRLK